MRPTTHQTPVPAQRRGSFRARARARARVATLGLAAAMTLATSLPGLAASDRYPVTLTDDEGTRVTIEAPPGRVISLSPAITETAFALGAGDLIVGGTDSDDYPPEAADLPDVATFMGVIMEQVVALEPDLVIAAGNDFTPALDIERMRELGLPVVVVYAASVEGVLADIELIGDALDRPEEARALTDAMRTDIDTIRGAVEATGLRPRTFYEIGAEREIYAPAPDSFLADMVELAGGEAVTTDDPAVFSIAVERLVAVDPEVIVLGDAMWGVCPPDVIARPGWAGITAVREGAIRPVDGTLVTRPGPRLAQGLASLARAIHPEIELQGFAPDPAMCEAPGA